jgi:ABC-type phosphate transport system ATPase subunit
MSTYVVAGGQAQRALLAVMLALGPQVLLLDEPTSALDYETSRQVENVLKGAGITLVWVSHDPDQPARVGGTILQLVPPMARVDEVWLNYSRTCFVVKYN